MNTDDLKPNSGELTKEGDQFIALYKDDSGQVTKLSAVCTHKHCIVRWNDTDKTWDCPCHGSRYDKTGKVIHGPAEQNLSSI